MLFTIYGRLHPESDVDWFYILRKDAVGGLIAIEDWVELTVRGLKKNVHGSEERLIQAARENSVDIWKANVLKKVAKDKKLKEWE